MPETPPHHPFALPGGSLLRHNVRTTGQGRPLVFAHGYGCDQNVWRAVAPAFEADHRVVLFDHAGCGRAAACAYDRQCHATPRGHAEDIIDVCQDIGPEPVILVAHSVSVVSAVLAARARPSLFRALVLVAPSPSYLNNGGYTGGFEREGHRQPARDD